MASPIPHNWDVPQVFRDRFGTRAGRQRVMAADGHLLIVLHELPSPDDPDTINARLYWRRPDGTWKSTEHVVESQHRLNLIAATCLPITAISALLSMNLEHGLESYNAPYMFWGVAAAAFVLGLVVRASLPSKKRD